MRENKTWLLLLLLLCFSSFLLINNVTPTNGVQLTDYIQHYEPVFYDEERVHSAHHRAKRSAHHQLTLSFRAHGRDFNVRLRRDNRVYSSDLVVENSHGPIDFDSSRAYVGHLQDEHDSNVHGIITSKGIFEGKITTANDTYVVERASRYFSTPDFHSVIYRHSDVRMPHLGNNGSLCRAGILQQKLKHWQTDNHSGKARHGNGHRSRNASKDNKSISWIFEKSPSGISPTNEGPKYKYLHQRHKRAAIDPAKTMCTLYVQADHLFYQKFDSNEEMVIEQLTQHIQGVNQIYEVIDFDRNAMADNVTFIIKRIKVHTDPYVTGYRFPDNYGVETYLELFSEDNFDAFCLAYMFTYRDFEGGTLGLAWTGDLENAGGVCEKNGQFRGSAKSLNSGIVTILNYGKDVPSSVSHVTMAHEIGHNMGSQHDPETHDCSPGGENGNYIMFARATSGDKPNNNRFSRCSKVSMATVMEVKARDTNGCFLPPITSLCGNGVVEEGEECDCGWDDECHDPCCHPQTSNHGHRHREKPCTRTRGSVCSPSEGPCCSYRCQLITPAANVTCREATPCRSPSRCEGRTSSCPPSYSWPDRTICDANSVCYNGECTGSICLAYHLESCQCPAKDPNDFSDANLCKMCCKVPGDDTTCKSTFAWNLPTFNLPSRMAEAGSPCNDYKGYCDVFHKCREVDPAGPLAHLKRLIFSSEGLKNIKIWLCDYWYVLVTITMAFVTLVVIVAKVCGARRRNKGVAKVKSTPIASSSSTSSSSSSSSSPPSPSSSSKAATQLTSVQQTSEVSSPPAGPKRGKRQRHRTSGTPLTKNRSQHKSDIGQKLMPPTLPPSPPPPPYSFHDDPYNTCHHSTTRKLASQAHKEGWV